jgi:predicted RND superfamily exporter protein
MNIFFNFLVDKSKFFVFLLILLSLLSILGLPKFQLDASSDTLLLDNDPDLKTYRENSRKYGSSDFLVIAFTPNKDIFTLETVSLLKNLVADLKKVNGVKNVLSLFDVPLLKYSEQSISELAENVVTLSTENVDLAKAKYEFETNEVYRGLLISEDLKTIAFQMSLEPNKEYQKLISERYDLLELEKPLEEEVFKNNLEILDLKIDEQKKINLSNEAILINEVRSITNNYKDNGEIFLGGGAMIAHDTIKMIQQDLFTFGVAVFFMFVLILSLIFKQFRWVAIPLISACLSALFTTGLISWMGWKVTVVSANFIALLMIIGISLTVHLVVRYREITSRFHDITHSEALKKTLSQMFLPCLYTALTTMVAFASLIISDIRPIIDFGLLMVLSIFIAFTVSFIFFGSLASLMKKNTKDTKVDYSSGFTTWINSLVVRFKNIILLISLIGFIFSLVGINKLSVENKFIDYFKPTTEIYQGLSLIDKKLGGTAPLDIIISAPQSVSQTNDEFEEDFDDFGIQTQEYGYWFNSKNLSYLEEIHDYLERRPEIGKVLSVSSAIKLAEIAKGEKLDDLELALLRKVLPEDINIQLLSSYISDDDNQVRLSARVIESMDGLNRKNLIDEVKNDLIQNFELSEEQFYLSGISVIYNNLLQSLFQSLIGSLTIVFSAIFIMFIILFRSLYMALIAMIPNLLSAASVLGIIGWSGIPLDIMTVTVAAISIGIGVDNTIHYVHRFLKEYERQKNYDLAIKNSHATIGRAMFYTSLTIVLGFMILVSSNFNPSVFFGIFTSFSMIVAILAALMLLPVLIRHLKPFGRNINGTT